MAIRKNVLTSGVGLVVLAATLKLTSFFEGEKHYVYLDQTGKATWCNGVTNNTLGKKIVVGKTYFSSEECALLLKEELVKHNKPFEKLSYELAPEPWIGLLDFNYNTGALRDGVGIYEKLKAKDIHGSCQKILEYRYIRVNGKLLDCSIKANKCSGIWTRRYAENRVCLGQMTVDEFLKSVGALPTGGITNETN